MAWHLAAITLTRGGRCNIAHCPPPIYSNGPLSCTDPSFFPSSTPRLRAHQTLSSSHSVFTFHSFLSSFNLLCPTPRVRRASPLFRHAREPLISADFARRVDPWNPCSCLSPAPARAGTSVHPSFSLFPSRLLFDSLSFAFVSTRRSRRKVFRRYPLPRVRKEDFFFSLCTKIVGYCILCIGGRQSRCKF